MSFVEKTSVERPEYKVRELRYGLIAAPLFPNSNLLLLCLPPLSVMMHFIKVARSQ